MCAARAVWRDSGAGGAGVRRLKRVEVRRRRGVSLLLPSPPHSVSHRPAPGLWPVAPWVMGRPIGVD